MGWTLLFALPALVDDGQRQMHDEGRALALSRAARADRPAVQLDQVLHDRQPETQAAELTSRRRVRLPKPLEYVRQGTRGSMPMPVSAIADLDVGVDPLQGDLDLAVSAGELDRVREQVPHDLLQAIRVAGYGSRGRVQQLLQANAFGVRRGPHRLDRGLDDLRGVDRLHVEPELPGT